MMENGGKHKGGVYSESENLGSGKSVKLQEMVNGNHKIQIDLKVL